MNTDKPYFIKQLENEIKDFKFKDDNKQIYFKKLFIAYMTCHKYLMNEINKTKTNDECYELLDYLFNFLIEIIPEIDKERKEDIKYFTNRLSGIYMYTLVLINFMNNNEYDIKYNKNQNIYKNEFLNPQSIIKQNIMKQQIGGYFSKKINIKNYCNHIPNNLKLKKILEKFINKLNSTKNLYLLNTALISYSNYNPGLYDDMIDYNINDFILSFLVYYQNLNDFSCINTFLNKIYPDGYINIYKITEDIIDIPLLDFCENIEKHPLKYNIYNLLESSQLNSLFNYKENFPLTLNTIIRCKHLIYHKSKFDNKEELLFMFFNFLACFEKNIDKELIKNEHKIRKIFKKQNNVLLKFKENMQLSNQNYNQFYQKSNIEIIKEKINQIHNDKINNNYYYDFKYFTELLYCLLNSIKPIQENNIYLPLCNNYKIISLFLNFDNNIDQKESIDLFLAIVYYLLNNNSDFHRFTTKYYNKDGLNDVDYTKKYERYYSINYINFKKPAKFVNILNNLSEYCWNIFENLDDNDIILNVYGNLKPDDDHKYDCFVSKRIYANHDQIASVQLILNKYKQIPFDHCNKISTNENNNYEDFKKLIIDDLTKNCIDNNSFKNNDTLFLNLTTNDNITKINTNARHANILIINFKEKYIDLYNPWGVSIEEIKINKKVFGNQYSYLEKFFKEDFSNFITEFEEKKGKLLNENEKFKFYYFSNNPATQAGFEGRYDGFCMLFSFIYAIVRLLFFDERCYSMNYVQEMINEYMISINHYLYFFEVVVFLYIINFLANIPNWYFYNINDNKIIIGDKPMDSKTFYGTFCKEENYDEIVNGEKISKIKQYYTMEGFYKLLFMDFDSTKIYLDNIDIIFKHTVNDLQIENLEKLDCSENIISQIMNKYVNRYKKDHKNRLNGYVVIKDGKAVNIINVNGKTISLDENSLDGSSKENKKQNNNKQQQEKKKIILTLNSNNQSSNTNNQNNNIDNLKLIVNTPKEQNKQQNNKQQNNKQLTSKNIIFHL